MAPSDDDGWTNAPLIEAAGGVVESAARQGRIAVIYRKRYGGEWGLPKGKREPGETWQRTALREVEEETGLKAVIGGIAGATAYRAGKAPKIVLYWRMRVDTIRPFVPNDEVTMLEWLSPQEALQRLTHADEANLIRALYMKR